MEAEIKNNRAYCPICHQRDYKVLADKHRTVETSKGTAIEFTARCKCGQVFTYLAIIKIDDEIIFTESVKDGKEVNDIKILELSDEDKKLIINAMMGYSVSVVAEAQEYKDIMPKETYEKNMAESERLVYLINVLEGKKGYDNGQGSKKQD